MNINKILPCFTPNEMIELGIYGESNFYGVESNINKEKLDFWKQYKTTGTVNKDYYSTIEKLYREYVLDPSLENKQNLLEWGWNPEIELNNIDLDKLSTITESKLIEENSLYGVEIIDICNESIDSKYLEDDDEYFNIENWTEDKYNILYVTGMSGSGKTTLATDLAKTNKCKRVELDYIVANYLDRAGDRGKQEKIRKDLFKDCPETKEFFTEERENKYHLKGWSEHTPLTKDFLNWFTKKFEGNGTLYIINGSQIFDALEPEYFKERAIIIKNPSKFKTITRRFNREVILDKKTFTKRVKAFKTHIKLMTNPNYNASYKYLHNWTNDIDNLRIIR